MVPMDADYIARAIERVQGFDIFKVLHAVSLFEQAGVLSSDEAKAWTDAALVKLPVLAQMPDLKVAPYNPESGRIRFTLPGHSYAHVHVHNWGSLQTFLLSLNGWVFRGHSKASWDLTSSLERSLSTRGMDESAPDAEREIVRAFQRQAHHFTRDIPSRGSLLEWAALVRHFGGPSRLLDFTRSPFVAAFFAFEAAQPSEPSAIWAIHEAAVNLAVLHALDPKFVQRNEDQPTGPDASFNSGDFGESLCEQAFSRRAAGVLGVSCGEPFRQNERLAAQQGVFLAPFDLSASFIANLLEPLGISSAERTAADEKPVECGGSATFHDHYGRRPEVIRITLDPSARRAALRDLKLMNITAASLFPGLDGFARSLRARLESGLL
jgi:hypothetical protein